MWFKLLQLPLGTLPLRWGCVGRPYGHPQQLPGTLQPAVTLLPPLQKQLVPLCQCPSADLVGAGSATPGQLLQTWQAEEVQAESDREGWEHSASALYYTEV